MTGLFDWEIDLLPVNDEGENSLVLSKSEKSHRVPVLRDVGGGGWAKWGWVGQCVRWYRWVYINKRQGRRRSREKVGGGGEHLGEISHGHRHNSRLHITTTPSVAATTIATTSRREGNGCGSAQ